MWEVNLLTVVGATLLVLILDRNRMAWTETVFHFKNLIIDKNNDDDVLEPDFPEVNIENELDADITSDEIYVNLFNRNLISGILPESWLISTIAPIIQSLEHYKAITILSCLGKMFTALLNNRVTSYLKTNNMLNQNQARFRKHHSTIDNISEYCKTNIEIVLCICWL